MEPMTFQVSGQDSGQPQQVGTQLCLKHSVTWNCSGDTALHFTPELWAFQGFLFLSIPFSFLYTDCV